MLYRQALLAQLRNPSDTSGRIFLTVFINLFVSWPAARHTCQFDKFSMK